MDDLEFLNGGGEMGARMRGHDWSTSPLGPPSSWPNSLRTVVVLMINSGHPMFCACGEDLGFLYNDAYAELLHGKHPDALGRRFHDVWPEIWADISPLIDAALAGNATYVEDFPLTTNRKGADEQAWFTFSYSPVREESGAIAGMFCAVTETTEKIIADRLLRESEHRLQAMADALPVLVTFVDQDHRYQFCNLAYEKWFGRKTDEIIGQHVRDLVGDEAYEKVLPSIERALGGESFSFETMLPYRLGGSRYVHIDYRPQRAPDGSVDGYYALVADISEQQKAATALRESEARFRNLADQSAMMVWVTDPDGACTFLSKSWYEFTGQREEEALGLGWSDVVHPDDREMSGETFVKSNLAQQNFRIEYRLRGADGTYRWAIDAATPLFGPDGNYLGYVGSVVDIDEQKKVEQSLAERVVEEVERRSQAEQALFQSRKIETLGQLTGGVAHDFNNLLTPIVGALDVAQKALADDQRAHRLVSGAIQAADRARILVQRLLAFSRRQHLQPQAVDVATLVNGISDLIHRSIGPHIALRVDIDERLAPARVDPNQLELALLNLAVNARDAMPEGGTLTISARTDRIVGHDRLTDGDYVRIAVVDSGSGMNDNVLQRAIEPFFTTKEIGQGTGLGLSSVQGLALQSGGELNLESVVGHGTTATLWLPLSDQQAARTDSIATVASAPPANATALLVDDEPLVRAGIAAMLDDLGYRVIEASSAAEAEVMVDSGIEFDLLITDHAMPGGNGTDLAQEMRARRPDLPVLLVTGYAKVAEDGGSGLARLSKPFRKDELARRLELLLAPAS